MFCFFLFFLICYYFFFFFSSRRRHTRFCLSRGLGDVYKRQTKGFALEATHLTDPDKLGTLLALLAFAVALTVKTGVAMARLHPIPVSYTHLRAHETGRNL